LKEGLGELSWYNWSSLNVSITWEDEGLT